MKLKEEFTVANDRERRDVLECARTLRRAGVIAFSVKTWKTKAGVYMVSAQPE
jgi:hypothetical protein